MKTQNRRALGLAAFLLWVAVALQATAVQPAQASTRDVHGQHHKNVRTVDHFVDHISTVPGIEGEQVELFVRERFQNGRQDKPAVLMVHGATFPSVPDFDLPFEDYSWMAFLAQAGFDVFAMDVTGYGGSARPMMDDPCNTTEAEQRSLLIPSPLPEVCKPSYPLRLTSIQSDWDDIDTVVDFIRHLRGLEKVNLLGWSRGVPRTGGYAARHPEKVERLFLYASVYRRTTLSDPPSTLPQPGVPMTVFDPLTFPAWDRQVKCADQFDPDVRDVISSTMLEFDPLGSTWGASGVIRAPIQNTNPATTPPPGGLWGWNPEFAKRIQAPTLIIRGELDTQAPEQDSRDLFEDLGTREKVSVKVACSSHYLVWENQHMILLRASAEWLGDGTFAGHQSGSFFVNTDGEVHAE